jgi:hypothetical protein
MKRGPVTSAVIRIREAALRSTGSPGAADALRFAWDQLVWAASEERSRTAQGARLPPAEVAEATDAESDQDSSQELTTKEAAAMIDRSPRWVRELKERGALSGRNVGRSLLIDAESVRAYLELRSVA